MKAHDDLTFNRIGATVESSSQNPPACLYKPRVCGNKAELLRRNPCRVWLSLARGGAGLADSRLTSPRDSSALLREVPLPLSFCGAPPARVLALFLTLSENTWVLMPSPWNVGVPAERFWFQHWHPMLDGNIGVPTPSLHVWWEDTRF